jgi:hypothetical protein
VLRVSKINLEKGDLIAFLLTLDGPFGLDLFAAVTHYFALLDNGSGLDK